MFNYLILPFNSVTKCETVDSVSLNFVPVEAKIVFVVSKSVKVAE